MKELLVVATLLMIGVTGEAPAPYPASGWRPQGPAFDLPSRMPPLKQEYLPVEPRRPQIPNFNDDVDVSVQGLPTVEQQPIFQVSPINGQQLTGPAVNADVAKLNPSLQQAQYQLQLEKAIQFARQRDFDAARVPSSGLPQQQSPRQFASQPSTTPKPESRSQPETTTESLNEGELLDDKDKEKKEKVSVEVTKQNIQEYPAELFLSPLAQLNLQQQFVPLSQLGQLRAPLYYPQVTEQNQGFDGPAHLAALPSVLAQRELLSQQVLPAQGFAQNPIIVQEQPLVQDPLNQYAAINQYQPLNQYQPVNQYQPQQPELQAFSQFNIPPQQIILQSQGNQIQPSQFQPQQPGQFQPQHPSQFQPQQPSQFQPQQPGQFQPQQPNQFQPQQPGQFQFQQPNQSPPQKPKDVEEIEQNDQQVVLQSYQPQFYQPQYQPNQFQDQPIFVSQPAFSYQNQQYEPQSVQRFDPNNYQAQVQGQGLQSGLDLNQQGNGIEQNEEREFDDREEVDEGNEATAVATAFGTRTQPRVFASYGAPIPKVQATQGYPTTTESVAQEETMTEDGPAIAQATAVATGRRSAKQRSRRLRPVFTLDRSGHLVLAQQ
ncbi:hypothetical protein KGM_201655 [Danaus plexippus plexippus]|uniref:Uncharacterized protein n=1 Tax=Danaus plexippus plexippus TaxID=278856 RepID=A0A212EIY3_DANPL|nr:hypothetical protein KGM_201655 [Danaus plexippus plexippus]